MSIKASAIDRFEVLVGDRQIPVETVTVTGTGNHPLCPMFVVPVEWVERWLRKQMSPEEAAQRLSESGPYRVTCISESKVETGGFPTEADLVQASAQRLIENGYDVFPPGLDSLRLVVVIRLTDRPDCMYVQATPYAVSCLHLLVPLGQTQGLTE